MPEGQPVILVVDDNRESFDALLGRIREFDGGRLCREFEFTYLNSYAALRNWYAKNETRFVSLIVQDVDFSQTTDRQLIMPTPARWRPMPTDFDEVGLQGIIIYNLLRSEKVDTIVPVLFVSSYIGMHRSREFAEYIVDPGTGTCTFVPEEAVGENYYPEVIKSIDELALRPLTPAQRRAWRENHNMVVGQSRRMAHLCHEIERIAPSDAIVLLIGEPGVGKELVARAIHRSSPRYDPNIQGRQRPWTVNIAALEKNLVEDELFGHVRGAFTDASTSRMGIFEASDGSTLFLDEIGDLSKEVQLKLLRVMEYREIKKLGSSQEMPVDNRIIAATNRTPQELLHNARPDFIGRLVQHCLIVPGLRNRWEGEPQYLIEQDVREMIDYFMACMNRRVPQNRQLTMTEVAIRFICQSVEEYVGNSNQIFTNNVRTIRNVVDRSFERAQAQHKRDVTLGEVIGALGMIKLVNRETKVAEAPPGIERIVGSLQLDAVERYTIQEAVSRHSNLSDAARALGIHRDTLRRKMIEYGLAEREGRSEPRV